MAIRGRTILITGGSGTLGRALAIALKENNRVLLGARNSNRLAEAERATGCSSVELDVSSIDSVRAAFAKASPDSVIHAAANKFVSTGEQEPFACIDANVSGSQHVARVAIERDIASVVGISTDAATPPAPNTYGLTKAIMERLFCSLGARGGTKFASVRLGNIAWSTGSVFPAWQQMAANGEIESTGPDQRRFFMTTSAATHTVLTALQHLETLNGKVLVPQMKAVVIRDALEAWTKKRGGTWRPAAAPSADRSVDQLIGELELPYARTTSFDGVPYYVISFNEKAPTPLADVVSTTNAQVFSQDELIELLTPPAVS